MYLNVILSKQQHRKIIVKMQINNDNSFLFVLMDIILVIRNCDDKKIPRSLECYEIINIKS